MTHSKPPSVNSASPASCKLSTIMTSNRPLEDWGKLLSDVPTAGAILDRFLHHAITLAISGRSHRVKDSLPAPPENKKTKKFHEPSTAEPAN